MSEVRDNQQESRFEVLVDGKVAGVTEYQREGDIVTFTHTEIDSAYEGQGLGGAIARGALDQVRRDGHRVIAKCEFIAGWIDKHPDYQDLLAS